MSRRAPGIESTDARDQGFVFDDVVLSDDDLAGDVGQRANPSCEIVLLPGAWNIQGSCGKRFPLNIECKSRLFDIEMLNNRTHRSGHLTLREDVERRSGADSDSEATERRTRCSRSIHVDPLLRQRRRSC